MESTPPSLVSFHVVTLEICCKKRNFVGVVVLMASTPLLVLIYLGKLHGLISKGKEDYENKYKENAQG